jgi:starch phosphorylase
MGNRFRYLVPRLEGIEYLAELALDARWSWMHSADQLWEKLDPELWNSTRNPWLLLQTVSDKRLQQLAADPAVRELGRTLFEAHRAAVEAPAWFQNTHADAPLSTIAYFSMEFMLSEALPIYSGGLGNVAGDQLKAASDLGVPVAGVGILYQQGYFRQVLDQEGGQRALYPYNDPGQMPVMPVRNAEGEWLRLELQFPGRSLWLRAWEVRVGRLRLYLLDSNDPVNLPADRGITSELYGGGAELRLQQEIVLGIGGWRLLHALGMHPEVCHLNEGHAALAVLERARDFMGATGQPFDVALAATRVGNLFTTHTAVPAGFDVFDAGLVHTYLGRYADEIGIGTDGLLALGRRDPRDGGEALNMAYLAIRGSGTVNGVSRLHGAVSRRLFQSLFPRWPEDEVPVGYVTNGVHVPTWDSAEADALWTGACGRNRWLEANPNLERDIRCASDTDLWKLRASGRQALIPWVRHRLARLLAAAGASPEEVSEAQHVFDPNVLTLGLARRFATYKRPNLLLHDPQRLARILTNPAAPVQLIISGKAHPKDAPGQAMVRAWIQFIRQASVRRHVVFVTDYDMFVTEHLVQGVDLWLNTPRRPWEASGTSGMKVLVNGGLNLSELDGWWAEAYCPEVGWALGDGREHGDDPAWDAAEADALYTLLEQEVVPAFYARDSHGIPTQWVAKMRESMARLTPRFSTNRTVREYAEAHYLPAAAAYQRRAADNGRAAAEMVSWQRTLAQCWPMLHFGDLRVDSDGGRYRFEVPVYLGELEPDSVCIELYAGPIDERGATRQPLRRGDRLAGAVNGYLYSAEAADGRPADHFTVRAIPQHAGAVVPLEAAQILWQR